MNNICRRLLGQRLQINFNSRHPLHWSNFIGEFGSKIDPEDNLLDDLCNSKYTDPPDMIYLAGGYPNSDLFPFLSATFRKSGKDVAVIDQQLMSTSLQYGDRQGYSDLIENVKCLMTKYHGVRNWEKRDIVVTNGASNALAGCLELVLGSASDYILAEDPLFGNVATYVKTHQATHIAIERDELGILPRPLRASIEEIGAGERPGKLIIYVNHMTIKRENLGEFDRRLAEIYGVAREFGALIIEVDPFLVTPQVYPSLLSLDEDNRVLRCDTVSHLLGPGIRVGFLTGPSAFLDIVSTRIGSTLIHAPHLSQILVSKILGKTSGTELISNVSKIWSQYAREGEELYTVATSVLKGAKNWAVYPNLPFIWFKLKQTEMLLGHLSNFKSQFMEGFSSGSFDDTRILVFGMLLHNTSKDAKKESCEVIQEFIKKYE